MNSGWWRNGPVVAAYTVRRMSTSAPWSVSHRLEIWTLCRSARIDPEHVFALVLGAVAVVPEYEDLGVVHEPVHERGEGDRVAEDLGPGQGGVRPILGVSATRA